MTNKIKTFSLLMAGTFLSSNTMAAEIPQALTIDRLSAETAVFLGVSENISVHELSTTSASENDVVVRIGGITYYFTPADAEQKAAFQTLADIGSAALKELPDSTGAVYKLGDKYYGYDAQKLPKSGYSLTAITKEEAESASYPVVTKYTRNDDNTLTESYNKVNISTIGSGDKAVYYKWEKDEGGKQKLVKTFSPEEADITAKYGKNSYSGIFKDQPKEYSVTDPSSQNTYAYGGAAIYNTAGTDYGDIDDTLFGGNHFDGTLIRNIDYSRTLLLYGGAVSNSGTIGSIIADFVGNYVAGNAEGTFASHVKTGAYGGAVYNDKQSTIGHITGNFVGNYAKATTASSSARGGAVYNYGSVGNIAGDFVDNFVQATESSSYAEGGAVYNYYNSTTGNITGDFVGNYAQATEASSYASGGAVYNHSGSGTGNITGDFIGNYARTTAASSSAHGGAVYNYSRSTTGNITGNFVGNYARATGADSSAVGGAIYNSERGTIGNITGDFINNYIQGTGAAAEGGAIMNHARSTIGNITGDFINNYAQGTNALGGAVYNVNYATIGSITGNFIGNYITGSSDNAWGGAIGNTFGATTGNITGDFINNYAQAAGASAAVYGGAIFNYDGTIGNITGNFVGNYALATGAESSAYGGAILNVDAKTGNITGDFINNYAQATDASSYALGGAIANYYSTIKNIINSNFIGNYVKGNEDSAGGAIWSPSDILITADAGTSLFSGNKANDKSNAIYMDGGANLNLSAVNKGTIIFDDGIDGNNYNINVTGDGSGVVKFNNLVENVSNFSLSDNSVVHLGLNADIQTQNMLVAAGSSLGSPNVSLPIITVDVEVDKTANTVNSGVIHVADDVSGDYRVLVNALNPDVLDNTEDAVVPFLFAPNDNTDTDSSFSVARVIGSPYLWTGDINAKGEETGSTWYLNLTDEANPDYKPEEPENPDKPDDKPSKPVVRPIAPEVIAGAGLHEAAIEQTRSLVRNVRNKVAAGREYCPNCGVYSAEWDGKQLRNVWVLAQGETATIDKPAKMDADIWGVEAGFDIQNDIHNTLGVFASYRKGEYDLSGKADKLHSNVGSEIDIDSYLAGLYYRYDKNMNWLFATVYGGVQQADAKTDDKIAKFDTDGIEFGAGVEAGHSYELSDNLILEPGLGLYYTQINFDDAKDNVGKEYDWKDIKHLEAELGAKLEKQIDYAKIYVKPSVIQTITSGDSVKITGLNKLSTYDDATLGRIELGGRYGFTDALSAYGWVNYTFGSGYDATAFGAGLNYAW